MLLLLAGHQYRKISCDWGGQSCKEVQNEQEMQPYCNNGNDIQVCPLDENSGFGRSYELINIDGIKRKLRSNPPQLIQLPNLPFQVRNCDKGLSKVSSERPNLHFVGSAEPMPNHDLSGRTDAEP